jgi:hypothetical protein
MVTKGGSNGTPSYNQVVVDMGKGPRGDGFKEPVTRETWKKGITWEKKPEKPIMMRKNQRTPMG